MHIGRLLSGANVQLQENRRIGRRKEPVVTVRSFCEQSLIANDHQRAIGHDAGRRRNRVLIEFDVFRVACVTSFVDSLQIALNNRKSVRSQVRVHHLNKFRPLGAASQSDTKAQRQQTASEKSIHLCMEACQPVSFPEILTEFKPGGNGSSPDLHPALFFPSLAQYSCNSRLVEGCVLFSA